MSELSANLLDDRKERKRQVLKEQDSDNVNYLVVRKTEVKRTEIALT